MGMELMCAQCKAIRKRKASTETWTLSNGKTVPWGTCPWYVESRCAVPIRAKKTPKA